MPAGIEACIEQFSETLKITYYLGELKGRAEALNLGSIKDREAAIAQAQVTIDLAIERHRIMWGLIQEIMRETSLKGAAFDWQYYLNSIPCGG